LVGWALDCHASGFGMQAETLAKHAKWMVMGGDVHGRSFRFLDLSISCLSRFFSNF
jgi:hypothetical protein